MIGPLILGKIECARKVATSSSPSPSPPQSPPRPRLPAHRTNSASLPSIFPPRSSRTGPPPIIPRQSRPPRARSDRLPGCASRRSGDSAAAAAAIAWQRRERRRFVSIAFLSLSEVQAPEPGVHCIIGSSVGRSGCTRLRSVGFNSPRTDSHQIPSEKVPFSLFPRPQKIERPGFKFIIVGTSASRACSCASTRTASSRSHARSRSSASRDLPLDHALVLPRQRNC
jgi:hypothetical protein